MATLTDGVFLRIVGLPFHRRLLPGTVALFAGVALADPMIDWHYLREMLEGTAPGPLTVMLVLPLAAWSWLAGEALAPLWPLAAVRLLRRQPLERWRWTRYLLPSLLPALAPVAALYWLAPLDSAIGMAGWGAAVLILAVARSGHGMKRYPWTLIGGAVLTAVVSGLLTLTPLAAWIVSAVSLVLLPFALADIARQAPPTVHRHASHYRATSAALALVQRDGRCLWRLERGPVLQLWLLAPAAGAFLFALRVNGDFEGRELMRAACILQLLALAPLYDVLVRLGTHLGRELHRRHWPITAAQRARALAAMVIVLSAPSTSALMLGAGDAWQLVHLATFLSFSASALAAQLALWTSAGLRAASVLGWSLWIWLMNTLLAALLPPWLYLALSLTLALSAWRLTQRALDRLAAQAADSSWEAKANG